MPNTYGNNGNRWWVGLNVASAETGVIHSVPISVPNGYESLPSGDAVDDALFAEAAAYNKAHVSKPNTVTVQHIVWFNINGPYASQAEANAAIPSIQQQNPAPGEFQQITAGGEAPAAAGGGVNFSSIQNALTAFYDVLTNGKMWRSLGWLLIGIIILIIGIALWVGRPISKLTPAGAALGSVTGGRL